MYVNLYLPTGISQLWKISIFERLVMPAMIYKTVKILNEGPYNIAAFSGIKCNTSISAIEFFHNSALNLSATGRIEAATGGVL